MTATFDQARALYGSDDQMARALFEQLTIMRLDLDLQQELRRRAEEKLQHHMTLLRKSKLR
jgi:hypothetical protein